MPFYCITALCFFPHRWRVSLRRSAPCWQTFRTAARGTSSWPKRRRRRSKRWGSQFQWPRNRHGGPKHRRMKIASAENMEEENTAGQGDATYEGSVFDIPEVQDQNPTTKRTRTLTPRMRMQPRSQSSADNHTSHINACNIAHRRLLHQNLQAGITVTESSAVPVAQASPGRCSFSV